MAQRSWKMKKGTSVRKTLLAASATPEKRLKNS